MTMFQHSLIVLIALAVVFAVAKKVKVSTELSMFLATLAALITHLIVPMGEDPRSPLPFTEMVRHIVEGGVTYFDICLIFLTATFFMALYKETGGAAYLVRLIVKKFHAHKYLCLLLLMVVMLIPGAVTGSGATTVLTVGGLVGAVLMSMGVSENKRIALIFILAAMSAACPPINLWAMIAAAGSNMPYVGFTAPLAFLTITGSLFATFYLTAKAKMPPLEEAMKMLPEPPAGWNGFKVALPFLLMVVLIACGRIIPFSFPVLGMPLIFMLSGALVMLVSPKKVNIFDVAMTTVINLRGLVGIMIVVGMLNQIMTLTGARGLLSLAVVTLPITVIFATLWLILPVAEGVLQYAVAPLFGVPLIMLFNQLGFDPIVSLSTWAVMLPLGDCLPPTAVVGKAAVMELNFKGSYFKDFVKTALVPMLFILALCTIVMIFNNQFAALLG